MKLILSLVFALILASVAAALPEKVETGPYSVSFDLKDSMKYKVEAAQPQIGKTLEVMPQKWNKMDVYSLKITGDDKSFDKVDILSWSNSTDATFPTDIMIEKLILTGSGLKNVTGTYRKIDNQDGALLTATGKLNLFKAWYWLDKKDIPNSAVSYGQTKVAIAGNSSSEVVKNLLDTIHVEKTAAK